MRQTRDRWHRMLVLTAQGLLVLTALTGCGRAPSFSILGSFFPAWLICMVAGIILAAIVNWALTHYKQEKLIAWPVLVYPFLAGLFACTLWLVFFN
jgi:hypothetical protein